MLVSDILKSKDQVIITAGVDTSIKKAMELLLSNKISCLPVKADDGRLIGIISDKDIFRKVHETGGDFEGVVVSDCMTTNLIVGLVSDEVTYIAGVMTTNRIRHVPIVEKERIVGLVSVGDIVKTQIEKAQIENRYLKQYIEGNYPG